MDERIKGFTDELKSHLSGLPQQEIDDAVLYYDEYLSDALEAGKDIDAMIANLDNPQQIAATIRAESSISKAQQSPNIRSYSNAFSSAVRTVTTPFAVFLMVLSFIPSAIMIGAFFIVSVVLAMSAVIFGLGMIYQAVLASPNTTGVISSLGLGLLGSGVLSLLACLFFWLARLLIRLSALMIRRITKKPGQYRPEPDAVADAKKSAHTVRKTALVIISLILIVIGLILISSAGLPLKFLTIFNSMESTYVNVETAEFDPSGIDRLEIDTTHTNIRLIQGSSDKIAVTYEQVDWLDFNMGMNGTSLFFSEYSNETLPLFQLVQLHQNSADLTITLPVHFDPMSIDIESYGGFVYIDEISANIDIKTTTGSVYIESNETPANIQAITGSGILEVDGSLISTKTHGGTSYTANNSSDHTIDVRVSAGSIYISRTSQ